MAPIVLTDDDFTLVLAALTEGRRLFGNLRKAIAFYLAAKLALVLIFVVATLWHGFPLSAIQVSLHRPLVYLDRHPSHWVVSMVLADHRDGAVYGCRGQLNLHY